MFFFKKEKQISEVIFFCCKKPSSIQKKIMLPVHVLADVNNYVAHTVHERDAQLQYLTIDQIRGLFVELQKTREYDKLARMISYFAYKKSWACFQHKRYLNFVFWTLTTYRFKLFRLLVVKQFVATADIQAHILPYLCAHNHGRLVKFILQHSISTYKLNSIRCLLDIVATGNLPMLKFLARSNLILAYQLMDHHLLSVASVHGHGNIVRFLIRKGVNPKSIYPYDYYDAIWKAISCNHLQIVRILIKRGQLTACELPIGLLATAIRSEHWNIVRYLIKYGLRVSDVDDIMMTVGFRGKLHYAQRLEDTLLRQNFQ